MAYADYEYYKNGYLLEKSPAVPEAIFRYWEKQARTEIDALTYGRLRANPALVSDEVKDCVCSIAELLYKADSLSEQARQAGAVGPLESYSNDGESASFSSENSIYTESGKRAEVKRLVQKYLGNTGLLYAGVRRCEF